VPQDPRNNQYSSRAREAGTVRSSRQKKEAGKTQNRAQSSKKFSQKSSSFNASESFDSRKQSSASFDSKRQPSASFNGKKQGVDLPRLTWAQGSGAILILFLCAAVIVFVRLVDLQIFKAAEYSEAAQNERIANITTPARRGTIYDCNGNILAISVPAADLYCDPSKVTDPKAAAKAIVSVLGGTEQDEADFLSILTTKTYTSEITKEVIDLQFAWLKRGITVEQADKILESNIAGLGWLDSYVRQYPYGETAGQVIGACQRNADDELEGISGLEKYYNDVLAGSPGRYILERSRTGDEIPGAVTLKTAAVDGQSIMISLDVELQATIEARLVEAYQRYEGTSTSCIIMDGVTGEIRVAASLPFFNPADRTNVAEGATEVKGFTQPIEPGSTFKTVSAMAILEEGTMTPDNPLVDCPAEIQVDEYKISDAHDRGDEVMTLREIIDRSSNVGISRSVKDYLGFDKLYDAIIRYNLNDYTGIDWDESIGYLLDYDQWSLHQSCCISFGQGVSCTPLQLTRFYGAMLNNGYEATPHFLVKNISTEEVPTYESTEVIINKEAIPQMIDMLKTVVTDGTGSLANLSDYTVAGKTGTAEIASPDGGYLEEVYNISFISFLPESNSNLVFYVGGSEIPYESTMTLVSRDIMSYTIDRYRITE